MKAGFAARKGKYLGLGILAVLAGAAGFFAGDLGRAPAAEGVTITFRPDIKPILTPQKLMVTNVLVKPYQPVKRGDPIYEAYVGNATVDEAIAVIRLRQAVVDMRRASGGKETPTTKQFVQKIRFSEAMMKRGGQIKTFSATESGIVMPYEFNEAQFIAAKSPVLKLARFDKLRGTTKASRSFVDGSVVDLVDWRPATDPTVRLILDGANEGIVANPSVVVPIPALNALRTQFNEIEIVASIRTQNSTVGSPLQLNVPPEFATTGNLTAWSLSKSKVPSAGVLQPLANQLKGTSVPNQNGQPRRIGVVEGVQVYGYKRQDGKGEYIEVVIEKVPPGLALMAQAWWRSAIPLEATIPVTPLKKR